MFDELKKKLGIGSSKLTEPTPVAEPEPAAPEPETEGSYHSRKMAKKREMMIQRRDEEREKRRNVETMASIAGVTTTPGMGYEEYSAKLAESKRDFKSGLGSIPIAGIDDGLLAGISPGMLSTLGASSAMHTGGLISSGIGHFAGGAILGAGKSTLAFEELTKLKAQQDKEHEVSEMKRLSKSLVLGVGGEMAAALASAKARGDHEEIASKLLKRLMIAASETGLNIHELLEEIEMTEEEKSKEALALEALAKSITEYWASPDYELDQDQFALSGPVSLTILRAPSESHKSGYGKKAHIGGEEFIGEKAYLGKRGHIICCFKPVGVEDYMTMEMPLGDCFAQLTGFQKHFVEQGFNVQFQAIRDAKNQEKQAADLEKFSSQYSDFGSF